MFISIYIYLYTYISSNQSACGLLKTIRFDFKSEEKRREVVANRKANCQKRSESEAKSEASRCEAIDEAREFRLGRPGGVGECSEV